MDLFNKKLGRRQFMTVSSMILGAGALGAGNLMTPKPAFAQLNQGDPITLVAPGKSKWGHYIFLPPEEQEDGDRGTPYFQYGSGAPEAVSAPGAQMRMVPSMAPYPPHPAPEKHKEYQEVLAMIGLDPNDPMDLRAEAEFYLGKGKTLEKYPTLKKSVCVYVPRGQWHWPWCVTKVHKPMAWIHFNINITKQQMGGMPDLSEEEMAAMMAQMDQGMNPAEQKALEEELSKAETDPSKFQYKHLCVSGVGVDKVVPKGGKWVVYLDTIMVAEAPLLRILQYHPEEAPYPIIGEQTHEYETFFGFYGMEENNLTPLGADVELYMGPEKEKHTINTSALAYMPADTKHGPFIVKNAKKPFLFVECVGGPEHPGAIYDNEIDYDKYKRYL
jgi:hypothetical protein